jgi:hypothetical protein
MSVLISVMRTCHITTKRTLRLRSLLLLIPFSALSLITCDGGGGNGLVSYWVQYEASGGVIARAITEGAECPEIKLDGENVRMEVRAEPNDDFPVLSCEASIPEGVESASIEGKKLKLPKANPERIVILGDTGCRINGSTAQDCNDPDAWPFKKIADVAASFDPDLVIHMGDYHYRESPCPEGDAGCAGSPYGDNWSTWDADFFSPADKLLKSAPWVVTRGNHEMCTRGGKGWFRFLDPHIPFQGCMKFTTPYVIDIGSVDLLMLDSASAQDNSTPPDLVRIYAEQISTLFESASKNSWFVLHHPLWGIGQFEGALFKINQTIEAATENTLPSGINLVLSGHIHIFEELKFEGGRSPQMLVGNSGTLLDMPVTIPLDGEEIGGGVVDRGIAYDRFGFVVMDRIGDAWSISVKDVNGKEILTCELEGNTITCFE